MLANIIYPFTFGPEWDYQGIRIDGEYLKHEVYVYVGAAALLTAIFGLLAMKRSPYKNFLIYMSAAAVLLMILAYIPFVRSHNVPPLSLFRYWGRSVIFLVFAVACFAGYLISNPSQLGEISKKSAIVLFGAFGVFFPVFGWNEC